MPPKFFGLSMLLLTLPAFPGCATLVLFRSDLHCCRGRWPLGSPSMWGLDSLPALPQFNPSSFPQYKTKFHFVRRKSPNHVILSLPLSRAMSMLGKPSVPYPASACQGSHPKNTLCVLVLSATGEAEWPGRGPAHPPSRATPRHSTLCHCLQRSMLRPYHSFLALIVLSELKCCI